ncbi:MAG: CinA family protein, partial [Chitinophagaceae bacterium]
MNDLFDKDVLKRIGSSLIARSETIAVAESVTAGLLQFAFSNIPDASHFFEGGLTAYNLKQKSNQLRIEPLEAIQVNSISQHVADEMALHVSTKFITRWGIGVTGYASRVPENNPDLFAFYA